MNVGIILVLVIALVFLFVWLRKVKRLKISNVYFISGAVKTGKTYVSVALAVKTYRKNLLRYYLTYPLLKLKNFRNHFIVDKDIYKPRLYSNIKLRYVKFNIFTKDMLLRRVRIPNKSVVLLDETSLLADSMLFKDKSINDNLLLFYKLFGHYSHGGTLIANSQAISDNHYSLKRAMGRYLYVFNRVKWPFVSVVKGVELVYSDDNPQLTSMLVGDLEDNIKKMLFLNRYYKYYDCYCYSAFTDDLPLYINKDVPVLKKFDSLKCDELVTLQDFVELDKRNFVEARI